MHDISFSYQTYTECLKLDAMCLKKGYIPIDLSVLFLNLKGELSKSVNELALKDSLYFYK